MGSDETVIMTKWIIQIIDDVIMQTMHISNGIEIPSSILLKSKIIVFLYIHAWAFHQNIASESLSNFNVYLCLCSGASLGG